jgi:hypothetical protein
MDFADILAALSPTAATILRLAIMLAVGLLVRQAALPLGKRMARRPGRRVPALLSYAIAGTGAALARSALAAWVGMSGVPLWIAFGAVWGILAGLLLPFARRAEAARGTRLAQ